MNSLNHLYAINKRQEGIRDFERGFLVSIAGPGTGKTYGLLMRVEHLLDEEIREKNIIYLTFIREIVQKFSRDLDIYFLKKEKKAPKIGINTLHSIAWRILQSLDHYSDKTGHIEVVSLDWKDKWSNVVLKDIKYILERKGLQISIKKFKKILRSYLEFRRKMLDIGELDEEEQQFCDVLKEISNEYKMIDWDSVVPYALKAMKENELPSWVQDFKHFVVDEYQDLNPAENNFFIKLSSHAESVVIVGDNNQSVYRGRGASPQTLLKLAGDQDKYSLNLTLCKKRPLEKIVAAANRLLKIMAGKDYENVKLIASKKEGKIRIVKCPSAKKEVDFLVSHINGWKQTDECKNISGLFPTWTLANAYKNFLDDAGVTCCTRITGNSKRNRVRLVLKLLLLKEHPLIERLILSDFNRLNKIFMKEIRKFIQNGKIKEAIHSYIQTKKCSNDMKKEGDFYLKLIENLKVRNIDEALPYINSYVDEDLTKYKETILNFIFDDTEQNIELKCEDYLDKVFGHEESEKNEEEIQLLTMHSSKGLSKKYVFIPACEQRFIPSNYSGERKKELLRLFYIAITRAACEVLITYPRTRDKMRRVKGSQFGSGQISEFAIATGVKIEEL